MANKKKILMCAESHTVNSGFGRYTAEILKRLYDRKDYEIAEFASYYKEDRVKDAPWKVYPNEPSDNNPDKDFYKSNPINQFGQWRFDKTVLHFKPDIVFDIRDYWMFSYQELSPLRPYFHWVVAPTIDSIPQRPEWLKTFENADVVLTHTDWAIKYLQEQSVSINIQGCVTDSVNPNEFKPVSHTKAYHKIKYNIPRDSIVIGSVMRNQKRKLIPELFKSLKKIIETTNNKNIFLYLHTSFPEAQGWNIPELLHEFGVYNNVLFTYYCPQKNEIMVSVYKGPKIPHPNEPNSICIFPNVINGVTNQQLCEIYNCFDIYVQYAICEGLGIPQLEAASCGIPIFAINYSGMEEITTKVNGIKIKHLLSKELETGSERACPDNDHFVSEVIKWINLDKAEKIRLSKETRRLLVEHYSWDKTAEKMMEVFDGLKPKNMWDRPLLMEPKLNVPDNLTNRQFVYFIINHVIKSPELINTYFVQNMIRSLDESYAVNAQMSNFSRKDAVSSLEIYLNNKIFCEEVRSGQKQLTDKFLNY